MPRDANGNYTLPAGNPVVSGTIITTIWANPTMQDLGNEITNSLSRNGEGGMLVPFQNIDGTLGTPGMTWINDTKSGFYRAETNDMRATINGIARQRWTETTVQIWDDVAKLWHDIATTNNVVGVYLPLTGGALTGQLLITQPDQAMIIKPDLVTEASFIRFQDFESSNIGYVGKGSTGNDDIQITASVSALGLNGATAVNITAPLLNVSNKLHIQNYIEMFAETDATNTILFFHDELGVERGRLMALVNGGMTLSSVLANVLLESPTAINLTAPIVNVSSDMTVTGDVTGLKAPTAAGHLTRKDYVDDAVAAVGQVFSGGFTAAGVSLGLPAGWSVAHGATAGNYRITHNLGIPRDGLCLVATGDEPGFVVNEVNGANDNLLIIQTFDDSPFILDMRVNFTVTIL